MSFFEGERRSFIVVVTGLRHDVSTTVKGSNKDRLLRRVEHLEEVFSSVLADVEQAWEEGRHERPSGKA
jgi:hypothetical protein